MWKEILETKVIRIEGSDQSDLTTLVYLTDTLAEELNPYNKDKAFEIPLKTTCRVEIKSSVTGLSKSVSFNSKMFEEDGVQWLPLFEDFTNDFIDGIPEEVKSPRVLIFLQKKISLDVIKENGEKSEIGSACDDDYMPEIKLCHSFADNNFINPFDETFEHQGQEITEINNVRQLSYSVCEEINGELKLTAQKLMQLLEVEKKTRENLETDAENMKNRFLEELAEGKNRENDLLEELKDSEALLAVTRYEVAKLKNEIKALTAENIRLLQTNKDTQSAFFAKTEELSSKLQIYEESSSESDKILMRISDLKGFDDSYEKLKEKDALIHSLTNELNDLKHQNSPFSFKQTINIDELEETIQKYSKQLKLPMPLIRDKEQNYLYGNKKISILLKDGQLLCRAGGIFKPFDEYINNFSSDSIAVHKSVKSCNDVLNDVEETGKIKPVSSRKIVKSFTSGSKSMKKTNNY